jgi:hypothetical protein
MDDKTEVMFTNLRNDPRVTEPEKIEEAVSVIDVSHGLCSANIHLHRFLPACGHFARPWCCASRTS